ncbi:DUF6241 domain-containing protein [Bhargavaea cecembensis]|uniref:DUF6241 domain-containing protein n=1 Tax=Bhargavaea cecembensis TaxID=394098 RepID=UPI002E0DBA6B
MSPSPQGLSELLGIIAKWERGDFSEADKDHNYIWDLQDGTLGKARGLLGKEEELKFIGEWFLNEEKTEVTNEGKRPDGN